MKKLMCLWLAAMLLVCALPAALAAQAYGMTEDEYLLFEEMAAYLCGDWDSAYDDLIRELALAYEVEDEDILDFIDYAMEMDGDHVWIPVGGGKRYHAHADCSKMMEPRPCTKVMAWEMGFTACGRCKP